MELFKLKFFPNSKINRPAITVYTSLKFNYSANYFYKFYRNFKVDLSLPTARKAILVI